MNKIKKFLLCIIILIILITGCFSNKNILFSNICVHKKQIHKFDSPYTICYDNNNDTYTMYIFSSPIQFKKNNEYKIIDNTIIKSKNKNFKFENKQNEIKTYFPNKLSEYFLIKRGEDYISFKPSIDVSCFSSAKLKIVKNMYGDKVKAVIYESEYEDMVFYCTKFGIRLEIVLKEKPKHDKYEFYIKTSIKEFESKNNGYILLKDENVNKGIIYSPIVMKNVNNGSNINLMSNLLIDKKEEGYKILINLDKDFLYSFNNGDSIVIDSSFEMYNSKLPDTSVYSNFNVNSYLSQYSVLGKEKVFGEGWHYTRFRLNYFMTLDSDSIIDAKYYVKSLYVENQKNELIIQEVEEQWSSTSVLWKNRSKIGNIISSSKIGFDDYYVFEIKDYVKSCFKDYKWQKESLGIAIKSSNNEFFRVIATSDNSLYPHYIKIIMKKLPAYFEALEDINLIIY